MINLDERNGPCQVAAFEIADLGKQIMAARDESLGGIIPVLATPFTESGSIDAGGMEAVASFAVASGAGGVLYPTGASEAGQLSGDERRVLVEAVATTVRGRCPLVVGLSAPSVGEAIEQADEAQRLGASSVLVMLPEDIQEVSLLVDYCRMVASAFSGPLLLAAGVLATDQISTLVDAVPAIAWVKEETPSSRITRLLAKPPANLRGVFGGAGARHLMVELARGICGSIPSCESVDTLVRIWKSHELGDTPAAREVFNLLLPLLNFLGVFRVVGVKEVLRHRGIITSAHCRRAVPAMDSNDRRELTKILNGILG